MARLLLPKGMSIEQFTLSYPPSSLTDYSWIQVFSSDPLDFNNVDQSVIYKKGDHLMNLNLAQVQEHMAEINKLAKQSKCTSGKWMLKIKPQDIGTYYFESFYYFKYVIIMLFI